MSTVISRPCWTWSPGRRRRLSSTPNSSMPSSSLQTNTNGMPRMGNSYQIEGVDNNERTGLLQVLISPSEAISTVSVSTSNHDIELGRGTGAITNVMLKSGTNQFHGEAYWFGQNSALDARSFFNPIGRPSCLQSNGRQHRRADQAQQDLLLRELCEYAGPRSQHQPDHHSGRTLPPGKLHRGSHAPNL